MSGLVLLAFRGTGIANECTDSAKLAREASVAGHERGRQSANRGALSIEQDTITHHRQLCFAYTTGRAVVASVGASAARRQALSKYNRNRCLGHASWAARNVPPSLMAQFDVETVWRTCSTERDLAFFQILATAVRLRWVVATLLVLLPSRLALARPETAAALALHTRFFPFQDQRYLYRDERHSGAAFAPSSAPNSPLPLVVLLHGINPGRDLHLWLGGGARDLRPLAQSLMDGGAVRPFVLAAPSQTKAAGSPQTLWSGFELASFVDAVAAAYAGHIEIDRETVLLVGHSGAGCNPGGGLASEFAGEGTLAPRALVSIDPCLDAEMGAAMSRRPSSVPLLLWWQSEVWPRDPLAFWAALTLNQTEQRLDRMQELEPASANPHDAILPIAFERALRELLPPPPGSDGTERG
ncbi:MAG TPA: hypothetical protein VHB79_04310 [Polyangiaceae bacterium]|nr:hypothetical protein [Polyangiaceae bacterium]